MLSSLINFPARQDACALKNMDPRPVKAMDFYRICMKVDYYWCRTFVHPNKEIEGRCPQHGVEGKPDLVIAGLTFPVYSHVVEAKENIDMLEMCQDRVYRSHGFHNDREFMDSLNL